MVMVRSRGRSRRAASSAPATEPIAMTEESRPNSPAPCWNWMRAIVEMKIGKFKPIVPIRKIITKHQHEIGPRART